MRLYGQEPIKVGYHLAKFCGKLFMFLVCHVILQNDLIRGSCDFFEWGPLMVSRHLAKIGGHRHFGSGGKTFLICI